MLVDFTDHCGDLFGRCPAVRIGQQRRVLTGRVGALTGTAARGYPTPITVQWNDIRSGLTRHDSYPNLPDPHPWNWLPGSPPLR
ncbi:hypothetical protein NIIDMKKI_66290 [Mycobacterium kansasii]|uniref:Uncharacterized protein n=2 Tax=Mycobacterium kansasii TaxID=1768 RepID=A0A7G1INL6_MYCKA|nr:hypothetical protein NIIDMKKI_66290 [Mycobacterium kansasii]